MNSRAIIATAAMLVLAACGQKSEPAQTNSVSSDNVSSDNETSKNVSSQTPSENGAIASQASAGQTFANTAAASAAFEIASSKLALTKATSKAVKTFAQRMIDAHTASTAKLKAAASSALPAITPDPALSANQQEKVTALQSHSGAGFDSLYIDDQIAAHQTALDALRGYSSSGDVPTLMSVAAQLVPIVTAHLNAAQSLKP